MRSTGTWHLIFHQWILADKEMHLINHKGKQNNLSLMEIVFSRYRLCSIVHTELAWLKTSKQQCTQPSITWYFLCCRMRNLVKKGPLKMPYCSGVKERQRGKQGKQNTIKSQGLKSTSLSHWAMHNTNYYLYLSFKCRNFILKQVVFYIGVNHID